MKNIIFAIAALLLSSSIVSHAQTISGNRVVCLGASRTVLTISTSGGAWSSGNVSKATINAATGEVTGVAAGTATISYTILPATTFTTVVTVNAISVSPIGFSTGSGSLCTGGSPTTCTVAPIVGNAWSSSDATIATVNTGGLVTPSATNAGTVTITYHHGTGNCDVALVLTVNPTPAVGITTAMCVATTQTATATPSGGTWASSNTGVGTINASTGIMTGSTGGTTNISYSLATGCRTITSVTVSNLPATIMGALTICVGNSSALSSTTSGGTWTSSNTSAATIGSSSGIVTGMGVGTSTISYVVGSSCYRTAVVTVNAGLASNTGSQTVCVGQTTTLANSTSGGSWSSSAIAKATVGLSSGIVTGVSAGTSNITYNIGTGCYSVSQATVNTTLAAITGNANVCIGSTTTLSHPVSGGTWTSSNNSLATVNGSTGVVTGVTTGSVMITYSTSTGCYRTISLLVKPLPAGITGSAIVCPGTTTTLSCSSTGGTWSSSNTGTVTIGSSSGIVTGVSGGTALISYTLISSGCYSTYAMTAGTSSASTSGSLTIPVGASSTLSGTPGGGIWSSSDTSVATITSSSGIMNGAGAGTATISYTVSTGCGTAIATSTVTVSLANISGTLVTHSGLTTTLSSSFSGGSWSSSNLSIATINPSSGVASGISDGTTTITYSVAGIHITASLTVNLSADPISGGDDVLCIGSVSTLTDSVPGGKWTSSDPGIATVDSASGTVTGVSAGTAIMTYAIDSGGIATKTVTVNAVVRPFFECSVQIPAPYHFYFRGDGTPGFTVNYTADIYNPTIPAVSTNVLPLAPITLSTVICCAGLSKTEVLLSDLGYSLPWRIYHLSVQKTTLGSCVWPTECSVSAGAPKPSSPELATLSGDTESNGPILLTPNPNTGTFTVTGIFSKGSTEAGIEISNVLGDVVWNAIASIKDGNLSKQVNLDATIANGMYLVKVKSNESIHVMRFLLQR